MTKISCYNSNFYFPNMVLTPKQKVLKVSSKEQRYITNKTQRSSCYRSEGEFYLEKEWEVGIGFEGG